MFLRQVRHFIHGISGQQAFELFERNFILPGNSPVQGFKRLRDILADPGCSGIHIRLQLGGKHGKQRFTHRTVIIGGHPFRQGDQLSAQHTLIIQDLGNLPAGKVLRLCFVIADTQQQFVIERDQYSGSAGNSHSAAVCEIMGKTQGEKNLVKLHVVTVGNRSISVNIYVVKVLLVRIARHIHQSFQFFLHVAFPAGRNIHSMQDSGMCQQLRAGYNPPG